MSTSPEYVQYVLDQLGDIGVIQTAKMFGGVMLKVDNKQLGIVLNDTLYFRVKETELREKFTALDSEQFEYLREDTLDPVVVKNWWSVPQETLEHKQALVGLAYEVLLQGK